VEDAVCPAVVIDHGMASAGLSTNGIKQPLELMPFIRDLDPLERRRHHRPGLVKHIP
jgi:hypothetical protein